MQKLPKIDCQTVDFLIIITPLFKEQYVKRCY